MDAATIENIMEVSQKTKIELSYNPEISLMNMSEENKNTDLKKLYALQCSLQHYLQ